MDNGNLILTSEQYLQQLKYELKNNEACVRSNEQQQNDDLLRVKNDVQKCYEKILEEKSQIIKNQMDENNQVTISYQQLSMKHNELICKLENSENNVRHLQKEICMLQDEKSKLVKEIKEKEKLRAICEDDVCKLRCRLDGCSNDNERMTKHIATLESDLKCKTTELSDEKLCVKRLKDTMEKHKEERLAIEWKLKCCQLKQEANANKKCEQVHPNVVGSCPSKNKLPKCCCSPINDELSCLKKKNKELQLEIDQKNTVINVQNNKHNETKCLLKQIKLSLENCKKSKCIPLCLEKSRSKRTKMSPEKFYKLKCEIPCSSTKTDEKQAVDSICSMQTYCNPSTSCCKSVKYMCNTSLCTCKTITCTRKSSPSCCKPWCKPSTPCCEPSNTCFISDEGTCETNICTCKMSPCTCKPSPPCCKSNNPCCKPSTPSCKPSTPCCQSIKCTCKPSPPCCKPSTPCCKPSTQSCNSIKCTCKMSPCTCKTSMCTCKTSSCTCKTSSCTCKTSSCIYKPSTPCCNSIKCTCKTISCTCKTSPCTCKTSMCTCKTSPCTCKTSSCTCKTSSCICKPSTPCCNSIKCTCKTISCTCKTSPCTCKTSMCTCKTSSCTCKTNTCTCKTSTCTCKLSPPCCKSSTCCSSCDSTIPPYKCKKFISDETHYTNQLQKTLIELNNLKSDIQQLSKIK